MEHVTLKLAPATLAALRHIGTLEGITAGQIVREAIARDLYRRTRAAKKADKPDERLIAPLRALLADDFAYAKDWGDLAHRLKRKGYEVRPSGGGVALYDLGGRKAAKCSDLGYSYSRLIRRFQQPMPEHGHHWVAARILD